MFTAKLSTRECDRKQLWFLSKYVVGYTVLFDQRNKNKNNNKNNFESPPLLTLFYKNYKNNKNSILPYIEILKST